MKKLRIWIPLILALLVLTGWLLYQQRFAPIGEARYERTMESVDLSGAPVGDLSQLRAFPNLKQIDLRGTGLDFAEYEQVKQWFPEAEILWDIPFQGEYFDMGTQKLTLSALTQEDIGTLDYFTELTAVSAEECTDYETLDLLRQQRPDLKLNYKVALGDSRYSYDVTELTQPGENVEELFARIPYFPALKAVELAEPLPPVDRLLALREAFPESRILAISPDLTNLESVKEAFRQVVEVFGRLDILVNNAGVSERTPFVQYTEETFDKVMDLNVKGIFTATRAAVEYMEKQGSGVILTTSSMVSIYGQPSGFAYPASKFAVNGMTLSLARELGPHGIRVNAVAPGITETDMMKAVPRSIIDPMIAQVPLRRLGQPEDIANAFAFLASDEASYITGVVLSVDGMARS